MLVYSFRKHLNSVLNFLCLRAWLNGKSMFYETFICFYISEAKPLCFSLCSQMFDDVERCWIYNIQNVCYANEQLSLCYFFSIMFYKTLRYRLARLLTVIRLRYNFILLSKLICEKAYYVKDNVVLQGLCPSSNCLYANLLKSTMLRPLKGEVGYKLAASKWSKTPAQAPLAFNCQIDLMFFLKFIVFLHSSMANNVITCRCSSVIYPHLPLSPS